MENKIIFGNGAFTELLAGAGKGGRLL